MIAVGGLFVGLTLKVPPVQMVAVCAGTMGKGRTVIVLVRISDPQSILEASILTVYVPGVENNTVMALLPFTAGKFPRSPNDPLVSVYPVPVVLEELLIYHAKSYTLVQFPPATEYPPFEAFVKVMDWFWHTVKPGVWV
jgi:hypothetical protein